MYAKRKRKRQQRQTEDKLKKKQNRSSNWSSSIHEKHLMLFITGIHPLLSELCSGKRTTFLTKRYFMSLKLMQKIRKGREKKSNYCRSICQNLKKSWPSISNTFRCTVPLEGTCSKLNAGVQRLSLPATRKGKTAPAMTSIYFYIKFNKRLSILMHKSLWIGCNFSPFLAEGPRAEGPGYWITGTFDTQRLEPCLLASPVTNRGHWMVNPRLFRGTLHTPTLSS